MTRAGAWAVVPVKAPRRAKQRLAGVLDADERGALSEAMLSDVVATLGDAPGLSGVLVVSGDAEVRARALALGVEVLDEAPARGLNGAIAAAAGWLARKGRRTMLVVPADVPLATGDEIAAVLAGHGALPAVTLVSDRWHKGTNALACSPPEAIPTCFGRRSFAGHRQLARARGIAARVLSLAGLALDVDTPDDLRLLLAHPPITRTHAVIEDRGIARRLRDATALDDREGACRQFAGGGLP